MATVVKSERNADDHAGVRGYPTTGSTYHQRASQAATPAPDTTDRAAQFAGGADPQQLTPLGPWHDGAACPKCSQYGPSYDQATARSDPRHETVVASRLIEGPNQ
jgi:hypothetical protein